MKTQIVFEEGELKKKFLDFAREFNRQSDKGYGVHLVSNETGNQIGKDSVTGSLYLIWNEVFGGNNGD